jgi:protein TonB
MDVGRFSLASDIVELVVLTADEAFLQTLRDAVGPSRRLWHVASSDKAGDLLLAGGVGILVLDVHALREPCALFVAQMKRQFPDLVVVVAGARDAESELARQISDGTVYRFIHKPMSPARAKLFADAAVKRLEEQRRRTGGVTAAAKPGQLGGFMIAGGCLSICALAGIIWTVSHAGRGSAPAPGLVAVDAATPAPAAGPRTVAANADSELLARAAQALAANRLIEPSGDNALELYLRELARNPGNAEARIGIAALRERLLARAQNALLEERLDEAAAGIETAHRAGADGGRISLLTAELAKARAQARKPRAAPDGANAATDPAAANAALALQRIQEGRLIDPESDSARHYVQEALKSNPASDAAGHASEALALGLLNAARGAIDRGDFKSASGWLDAADGIASATNVDNLRRLMEGMQRRAQEAHADPAPLEAPMRELAPAGAAAPADSSDRTDAAVAGPSNANEVIDASRLVVVRSVQPVYPREARQGSIEGWVELEFTVAESGQVKDLSVRSASPRGVFDQAARNALLQWRYEPVRVDGKAVPQRARIRIRFTLAR